MFTDRKDAGHRLAKELTKFSGDQTVVVAVPRGGVIVGAEIARVINAPLDVVISKKIGSPYNSEVAMGAVTPDGEVMLDERLLPAFKLEKQDLAEEIASVQEELVRRLETYRRGRTTPSWKDSQIILVDDGIATGFTLTATIEYVRRQQPKKIILAVPVAPVEVVDHLQRKVDELICLIPAEEFYAVGQFYLDFSQTEDAQVLNALQELGH